MRPSLGLVSLVFFLFCLIGYSQQTRLKIVDALDGRPVSFVHYWTLPDGPAGLSDADGLLTFSRDSVPVQILLNKPQYRPFYFLTSDTSTTLRLLRYEQAGVLKETDSLSASWISKMLAAGTVHNPDLSGSFNIPFYTKLSVGSRNPERMDTYLEGYMWALGIRWPDFQQPYRLLLVESSGTKRKTGRWTDQESINASSISGVERPSGLGIPAFVQSYHVYNRTLSIAGSSFQSFAHSSSSYYYHYKLLDTLFVDGHDLLLFQFGPKKERNRYEKLRGYFWLETRSLAIYAVEAYPELDQNSSLRWCLQQKSDTNQTWLPENIYTRYDQEVVNREPLLLEGYMLQHFERAVPVQADQGLQWPQEEAVIFSADAAENELKRPVPLSSEEAATSGFYQRLGKISSLSNYLFFGRRLNAGFLPVGKFDVELSKVVQVNDFEGLRIGLGGRTNTRFSEQWELGAYLAYGLQDNRMKGGASLGWYSKGRRNQPFYAEVSEDLSEPGNVEMLLYKRQFASEALRKVRLLVFDLERKLSVQSQWHPADYTVILFGVSHSRRSPLYLYEWIAEEQSANRDEFSLNELFGEARYAFGERKIRLTNDQISLKTPFPVLYFRVLQGLGSLNYRQWEFRTVHSYKRIGVGTFHTQFRLGRAIGELPYSRLFQARGSFRSLSAVSHNSFETMGFNEFLMDEFATIHFTFQLGKLPLAYGSRWFSPELDLSHNMGWGSLKNASEHQGISTRSMEQGYFESGFVLHHLLVLQTAGLKTGLGAGVFMRYGPYALPNTSENLVLKVALSVGL
jgi:hypothetical protein